MDKKYLYVPVDKEIHKKIMLIALERGIKQKDWMLEAVEEKLEKEPTQ